MKDLKDYLHLYLGCDCQIIFKKGDGLSGVMTFTPILLDCVLKPQGHSDHVDIVLNLRKLDSMTEEEKTEYNHRKQRKGYMPQIHADNTLWLLSKSFDLFGLIAEGLAIDRATLTVKSES